MGPSPLAAVWRLGECCRGVAILELIGNALAINRIDPYWVTLLQGTLILTAVSLGLLRTSAGKRIGGALGRSSTPAN